jgi:hypothetical protein
MTERILGETGSRRRRRFRFLVLPVVLGAALALLMTGGAQAVHDLTLFELDRNAVDVAATPGDDWNTLFNGGGSADQFTGVLEDISAPGEQFTGGGSKDNNDISQWLWKAGEPLDKDDITNAYTAAYTNTVDTGGNNIGDLIIYYGLDRFANNGTAQVGFWFFQNPVSLSNTASMGGFKFDGVHEVGDVLVQSNFTSGGRVSSVSVFEWVGSGGSNGSLNLVFSGTDCVDADPNTPGDQPLAGDDPACATANIADETAPWPYTPKAGTAGTFPLSSFFEGGVDITRLIPGGSKCFPTFMAETRSSAPFDSRLKDFQIGSFQLCRPSTKLTKSATMTTAVSVTTTATYTYTEENDGNDPLTPPGGATATGRDSLVTDDTCSSVTYSSGDDGNFILDPGETWTFTCTKVFTDSSTTGTLSATHTNTATGHGLDPKLDNKDVTFCPTPDSTKICDPDETDSKTITVTGSSSASDP